MSILALASAVAFQPADINQRRMIEWIAPLIRVSNEEDDTSVLAEAWLDKNGYVRECEIVMFVGTTEVAERICDDMIRFRAIPARGPDGERVHAVIRFTFGKIAGPSARSSQLHDATMRASDNYYNVYLQLGAAPRGVDLSSPVGIHVLVDDQGQAMGCKHSDATDTAKALGPAACPYVMQNFPFEARQSNDGVPVPYVRSMTVKFDVADEG